VESPQALPPVTANGGVTDVQPMHGAGAVNGGLRPPYRTLVGCAARTNDPTPLPRTLVRTAHPTGGGMAGIRQRAGAYITIINLFTGREIRTRS